MNFIKIYLGIASLIGAGIMVDLLTGYFPYPDYLFWLIPIILFGALVGILYAIFMPFFYFCRMCGI